MNLLTQQENEFSSRHIGPSAIEEKEMLSTIGEPSLAALVEKTVPPNIVNHNALNVPPAMSEAAYLEHVRAIGETNIVAKNFIGQGYYGTHTPRLVHPIHSLPGRDCTRKTGKPFELPNHGQ
jgi:glycine dehydrogenase